MRPPDPAISEAGVAEGGLDSAAAAAGFAPWLEVGAVVIAAIFLTAVMAWPVLQAPSSRLFGVESVGRHPDPFIVMQQYADGRVPRPYLQPSADLPGIALARLTGGVAAYNAVVLVTFPLAALAMYLFARHLTGSRLAAGVAAVAFAWSPFHIAHAAYHPHIAQVQWWPVYLLGLSLLVHRPSAGTLAAAALGGLLLSGASSYWMVAAAVLTPVAVAAWLVAPVRAPAPSARVVLAVAASSVVAILAGVAAILAFLPEVVVDPRFAFPRADLGNYAARWASYVLPPIEHPVLGGWARDYWVREGNPAGALEQQVMPGWGLLTLAAVAVWLRIRRGAAALTRPVWWLLILGTVALLCSLAPGSTLFGWRLPSLAESLYPAAPMFRSYARFGVVVTLAVAVLAGIGARGLWAHRPGRVAAAVLLAVAAFELRPAAARWRDLLPPGVYQHLAARPGEWRVLDCTPPGRSYGISIAVVVGPRVAFRQAPFDDCADPGLGPRLATFGFSHVLVRRGSREGKWLDAGGQLPGLVKTGEWIDELLFDVTASPGTVYMTASEGFHAREFVGAESWQWMPAEAAWRVMNRRGDAVDVRLRIQAEALAGPRTLEAWLGGERVAVTTIDRSGSYSLGPLRFPPGDSRLRFRVPEGDVEAGAVLGNFDPRRVAIRFDTWQWVAGGGDGR